MTERDTPDWLTETRERVMRLLREEVAAVTATGSEAVDATLAAAAGLPADPLEGQHEDASVHCGPWCVDEGARAVGRMVVVTHPNGDAAIIRVWGDSHEVSADAVVGIGAEELAWLAVALAPRQRRGS